MTGGPGRHKPKQKQIDPAQPSFADLLFPEPSATSQASRVREAVAPVALPEFVPVYSLRLVRTDTLSVHERPRMQSPRDAAGLLWKYLKDADREHFAALLLDSKGRVIGAHTVSIGDLGSALVHPREVFKAAIVSNAASILVAHNHPSGDPEPSPEDIAITRRLSEAGELLGIAVLDHVIVGSAERFVSLKERGYL